MRNDGRQGGSGKRGQHSGGYGSSRTENSAPRGYYGDKNAGRSSGGMRGGNRPSQYQQAGRGGYVRPDGKDSAPSYSQGTSPRRRNVPHKRYETPERRDKYAPPARRPQPAPPPQAPPEQPVQVRAVTPPENMLVGRNPIREALKAGRHFEALYVLKGELNGSAKEIVRTAREKRVIIKEVERRALEAMSPGHQGLVAIVSAHQYAQVDDIFNKAKEKGEPPLIVILDGVTDPHNMGAIARTAECCGAHGMILCERRAVGMTPGAAKAAAGAFEYLPVARVPNISRVIEQLKERGVWVFAADEDAQNSYHESDLTGPVALVIGDEGEGVSRLALEKCDGRVSIPVCGNISSLNASVAAGILLYDVLRQRNA